MTITGALQLLKASLEATGLKPVEEKQYQSLEEVNSSNLDNRYILRIEEVGQPFVGIVSHQGNDEIKCQLVLEIGTEFTKDLEARDINVAERAADAINAMMTTYDNTHLVGVQIEGDSERSTPDASRRIVWTQSFQIIFVR